MVSVRKVSLIGTFLFCFLALSTVHCVEPSTASSYHLERALDFSDSGAAVRTDTSWALADPRGTLRTLPDVERLRSPVERRAAFRKQGSWGFLDPSGSVRIPPEFERVQDFSGGLAGFRQNGKWGYLNRNGTRVIEPQFENARPFSSGLAPVRNDQNYGFVDERGSFVVSPDYNDARPFREGLAAVEKHDLWGFINPEGDLVIPRKFLWASSFHDGRARVRTGGRWGLIDRDGTLVDTFPYDFVHDVHEGRALFEQNGRIGYLSKSGTVAIPAQFEAGGPFDQGLAPVKSGNQWGFVDRDGRMVLQPQFTLASSFSHGRAAVKTKRRWTYLKHPDNVPGSSPRVTLGSTSSAPEQSADLQRSLRSVFPVHRSASSERYVSIGKGLVQPEWHREVEEEISNYHRSKLIYEVNRYPYELPDARHREAAQELLNRSVQAVRQNGWHNLDKALEDGFVPNQSDGSHFHHVDNIQDGRTLVPGRPEYLIFNTNPDGENVLAGFMYLANRRSKTGPQIGGPLTQWHYHVFAEDYCFEQGNILLPEITREENCPNGQLLETTTEMLHVWFVDHPDGRFGTRMNLPAESYDTFLYEKRRAPRNR